MKKIFAFLNCWLLAGAVFGQGIVSVDQSTGIANVRLPIASVSNGQVTVPISLTYRSNIKALDVEGSAGMGWNVIAGGQVTRELRGLPDDITKDLAGNSRFGWMSASNSGASSVAGFTINNNGTGYCPYESSDYTNIATYFSSPFDTEPDIFSVSAPGLSCKLVYNRSTGKFVPLDANDIMVTPTINGSSGAITSFSIIDNRGFKYLFSTLTTVTEIPLASGTPQYFTTYYKQFQYGLSYSSAWNLSSITDPAGNAVYFKYAAGSARGSKNPVSLYLPNATTSTLQYIISQSVTQPLLSQISSGNPNASANQFMFTWISSPSEQNCIANISGRGHTFAFGYDDVSSSMLGYQRLFLRSYGEVGCATPTSYSFSYGQETVSGGVYHTIMPDSTGAKIDYWGYPVFNSNTTLQPKVWINGSYSPYQRYVPYNASTGGGYYTYATTHGNDRSPELTAFNVANLVGVNYGAGGNTSIVYEPNTYKDVPSGQIVPGAGIRVKQLTEYDGVDVGHNIVKNYTYTDAGGVTSGKPVSLPVYAFTIPYSGTASGQSLWDSNTILSDYDLSTEDHTIYYGYFKESVTGRGSTTYQYYLPATNWDLSAAPGCAACSTADWSPTTAYTARGNCSLTYGPIKNDIFTYPFAPNLNYEAERGLLQSVTYRDDSNNIVGVDSYTYQRITPPSAILAFKYDNLSSGSLVATAYSRYGIYVNTAELIASETKTRYDAPGFMNAHSSAITYAYGSTNHHLPTQQTTTCSDGSVLISKTNYVKDYTVTTGSNPNVNAIYYLQQANMNEPVETYQQVTRGGVTNTTGGQLTSFKGFSVSGGTVYLPYQQKTFVATSSASFSPYSISGSTETADSRYQVTANFDSYDYYGYPQTVDDNNKKYKTMIMDHVTNNVTATISNALYSEIGFSDFDTDPLNPQSCNFSFSGPGFTPTDSHSGQAYGLNVGQNISKTISIRNPYAPNYIFSIWINASTSATLTVSVAGGTTQSRTVTLSPGWKYYEVKIPVSAMSSAISLTANCDAAVSVDDILFYPDLARATVNTYDPVSGYLLAETNTNGVSNYYTHDKFGRILFQFDQDKNIIHKTTYVIPAEVGLTLSLPIITVPYAVKTTVTNTYQVTRASSCLTPVTYSWNFGDGTIVSGIDLLTQTHAYATAGNYTLQVTASHPTAGTVTSSATIPVAALFDVTVCQSGVDQWSNFIHAAGDVTTCPGSPSDATHSYYTATVVGAVGTISYTWQRSLNNGSTWSTYSTGSNMATVNCSGTMSSFLMRCQITTTSGQSATSAAASFTALP